MDNEGDIETLRGANYVVDYMIKIDADLIKYEIVIQLGTAGYQGNKFRKVIYENFPLRQSQIYYQPKSKARNQNLSKSIDDVFLKK